MEGRAEDSACRGRPDLGGEAWESRFVKPTCGTLIWGLQTQARARAGSVGGKEAGHEIPRQHIRVQPLQPFKVGVQRGAR
jgi:hypothetical protein